MGSKDQVPVADDDGDGEKIATLEAVDEVPFSRYVPHKLVAAIPSAHPHPDPIVEAAALSSVPDIAATCDTSSRAGGPSQRHSSNPSFMRQRSQDGHDLDKDVEAKDQGSP